MKLAPAVGLRRACNALWYSRATFYREQNPQSKASRCGVATPTHALTQNEQELALKIMNSEEFCDVSPHVIVPQLLDQGVYVCSARSMYRILSRHGLSQERRKGHERRSHVKPELCATGPNQVWSWDITKVRGPEKRVLYYLYVVLDVYSRFVVGWHLGRSESAEQAEELFEVCIADQGIEKGQLTAHSDRGSSMKSQTMKELLTALGVSQSFSRPRVSNDNPYSESQFKTMKYRPEFPDRFNGFGGAWHHCEGFFGWYNNDHFHSGIGYLPPAVVHAGQHIPILLQRQEVLDDAFKENPQRFRNKRPTVTMVPQKVWINQPEATVLRLN